MNVKLLTLILLAAFVLFLSTNVAAETVSNGTVEKDCRYVFTVEDTRAWNQRNPADRDFDIVVDGCSYKKRYYYQEGFQEVPLNVAARERKLTVDEKTAAQTAHKVHKNSTCRRFYSRNAIANYLLYGTATTLKSATVSLPECVKRYGGLKEIAEETVETVKPKAEEKVVSVLTPKQAKKVAEAARLYYTKCRAAYNVETLRDYVLTGEGRSSPIVSLEKCAWRGKKELGLSS